MNQLRKIVLCLFGICVVIPAFARPPVAHLTDSFKVGKNRYLLKLDKVKDSENPANGGALYRYIVTNNGKSQTFEGVGGFVSTCYTKTPIIERMSTTKHSVAWMVLTGGLCGYTFSYRALVIAPDMEADAGKGVFTQFSFETKYKPYIKSAADSVDVWYAEQFWGHGGTATSVFLPKLLKFTFDDFGMHKQVGFVSAHLKDLPAIEKRMGIQTNFPSLFVAGFQNADPELMAYAISCCYKEDEVDLYKPFFKATGQEYLRELIQKTKGLRELVNESSGAQNWQFSSNNQ